MHPGVHAAHRPDRAALVMGLSGRTVTYGQLDAGSNRLARLLRQRGLRPGDSLFIWLYKRTALLEAAWAGERSGLYYTPVSSLLTPGEAAYILEDCGARALVASRARAEAAARVLDRLPAVSTRLAEGGDVVGFERYEDALAVMPAAPLPDAGRGRPMLYSSGTTGRPKGVRRPLPGRGRSGDAAFTMARYLYRFGPDSVLLCPGPLYHAASLRLVMAMTRAGGTVVVMERFDPSGFLELVERYAVTHALAVPTMFVRLLRLGGDERARYDLSSLQCCVHGGGPCPVAVKENMIDWWGPVLHEYYAGTEENGLVACTSEQWLAHRGTAGRPVMCSVHVLGPSGEELGPGQTGLVYFESNARFEYHNDPEKTRSSFNQQGWSTLGDVGYLDGDGYLFLTDRQAHTIVSGGVNVYPQEAENLLLTHPSVADAAVFGVPSPDLGEEVKAVVQAADQTQAGARLEGELISFCHEQLASFKCPRSVDFDAELPRHPNGKLHKEALKRRYWHPHREASP